jgi:hypothetical protein
MGLLDVPRDILELAIGAIVGGFGNWWFSRGTRERHAELLKRFGELEREQRMIRSALKRAGVGIQEGRDPASGELTNVRVVPVTASLSVPPVTIRADPPERADENPPLPQD